MHNNSIILNKGAIILKSFTFALAVSIADIMSQNVMCITEAYSCSILKYSTIAEFQHTRCFKIGHKPGFGRAGHMLLGELFGQFISERNTYYYVLVK